MIKSIIFRGDGADDYIMEHDYEYRVRPHRSKKKAQEVWDRNHGRGTEVEKYWEYVDTGFKNRYLHKTLLNRRFEFRPNCVNVLFGPNASGKTTIIKAIASYCMCGNEDYIDGYTSFLKFTPRNMFGWLWNEEKRDEVDFYRGEIWKTVERKAGNRAELEWDGSPTYFENSICKANAKLGEGQGGLLGSFSEEVMYHMEKNRISSGQNSLFMIQKLIEVVNNCPTVDDLDATAKEAVRRYNQTWTDCTTANRRYYEEAIMGTPPSREDLQPTILMDEIDKSLAIFNVAGLYMEAIPRLVRETNCQIILVSHSPLMVSRNIRESKYYNIISMDDEYTEGCMKALSGISFE